MQTGPWDFWGGIVWLIDVAVQTGIMDFLQASLITGLSASDLDHVNLAC